MLPRSVPARVIAITALLLVAAPAARAATPTVAGRITGALPSSLRAATEIQVFDAGAARLVAKATVSRTGAFRLSLPPGGYLLATTITPEHGRRGAQVQRVTPLTLAPGQRRSSVKIAKPTARAAAASLGAHAAFSQESGKITPGRIALSVEPFTGATGDFGVMNLGLSDLLQTDLTSTPCNSAEVANSRDRVLVEKELEFQKSRYVDPATRVTRNFIIPDIVVHGRLTTRGGNLGYALTLVDSRTGQVLETVAGSLSGNDFFDAEQVLATRLAKRLCAYGEVFEVTLVGTGTGHFATHTAFGTLAADKLTAKPTAKDAQGATKWEGSAPASWTNVTVTSNTDCSYADPVSGGTWTAKLDRAGAGLQVQWGGDSGTAGTATAVCPTDGGGEVRIAGQPTTALIGSTPETFVLPANGKQQITGGLKSDGDGWDNTLELQVRTIRVQRLG